VTDLEGRMTDDELIAELNRIAKSRPQWAARLTGEGAARFQDMVGTARMLRRQASNPAKRTLGWRAGVHSLGRGYHGLMAGYGR
jgi:hypothetical protein